MANRLSDYFTSILVQPNLPGNVHRVFGKTRFSMFLVNPQGADGANFLYPVGRFKTTDTILDISLTHGTLTNMTDVNMGIYVAGNWALADQAAIAADVLIDGMNLSTARNTPTSLFMTGTNAASAPRFGKPLWGFTAATSDPGGNYDLAMQCITTTSLGQIQVGVLFNSGD
jgi:hypothetical protein